MPYVLYGNKHLKLIAGCFSKTDRGENIPLPNAQSVDLPPLKMLAKSLVLLS